MTRSKKVGRATCTLLAAIVSIVARPAFADCGGEYCHDVYVDQLYVEASGGIWLQTSGTETALSCTPDSNIFLRLANGNEGLKNIYAALLAAQTAGLKVHVRIVGGSSPCAISYVLVDRQ
jgi:hypothetical protein